MGEGTVEIEAVEFRWELDRGMITVSHPEFSTKTTQQGGSPPAAIARLLARELYEDGKH